MVKYFLSMMILVVGLFFSSVAFAVDNRGEDGITECTWSEAYQTDLQAYNIISSVIAEVKDLVDGVSESLYESIAEDTGFQDAVAGAFALFIAIYGVMFTFGLVPLTLQQGLIRLAKFGLIAGLISATGWSFFSEYVVTFFNEGTDDLINAVSSIGAQGYVASEYEALQILDTVLESVFSIKNFIIMIALLSNPVVGTVLGLIYLAGFAFFILAIFKAVSVYLVALIARSILFGIAPVFFAFMLFQRTSFLFRGWLSQVIIFSLSPIFFFAFFSFYATMMTNAMNNMIGSVDLCWVQSVTWEGVPDGAMKSWKFCPAGATDPAECGKVKDINSADCSANITSCLAGIGEILPISNILTFLVIGYLAWRFGDLVVQIAGQIAQATQFMGRAGGLSGYFQGAFGTTGGRGGGGTTTGM